MTMYRFKSRAAGDLIMMAPIAEQILRTIGREPAPQGIVEASALRSAMTALEQAIAEAEKAQQRDDDGGDADRPGAASPVGLRQRAWPMLEMMRRSLAENADIVWGV